MADELCRVSVQSDHQDRPITVDLALPARTQVAVLMPSIIDLVHDDVFWPADAAAHGWCLSRVGGPTLDDSMSLSENDVRDGELLLLTTGKIPAPNADRNDITDAVVNTPASTGIREPAARTIGAAASLSVAGAGAVALLWSDIAAAAGALTSAVMGAAAAVAAVVVHRCHPDPLPCLTLAVGAVMLSSVAGFLVVPAGATAASLCLAAAAAAMVSVVLLRITGCGTVSLTAIATFSTLSATVAVCGVVWTASAQVAGAALAGAALGLLGAAPKLAIMLARLSPALPTADDAISEQQAPEASALRGHQVLTGLVMGSSAAAALGAILAASGAHHDRGRWLAGTAFAAALGMVLMLRARVHVDLHRRAALVACGIISFTAAFALIVVSIPRQAHWSTVVFVIAGLGTLWLVFDTPTSPVARRSVEVLEYVTVATVAPLGCWAADLYGTVRGLSLI